MAILLLYRTAMTENSDRANTNGAPVDRLSQIWRRINQHKLVQWSVAYVALAYGVQHAIILTSESFEWPNAVPRLSMLLFLLGLPLVMTFAWYHGERASRRFSAGECTIISLLLLCASLLFYVFVKPEAATTPARVAQEASVTAARAAAASPKGAISVAVLPFLNLSADKDQEFFSDGMTEEITAALAKVPDLRVVARTSAFEFKGKNVDIRTMGEQLGATHLIEGSVRKAGNRLRITAQLIKADDGTHIWAEDYDRDLTDVFAIQEDIARAITSSLHMTLGLKPGENLVNNRNIDPSSYEKYLRAKALIDNRGPQDYQQPISLLNEVVENNPDYAPAWARLSLAHFLIAQRHAGGLGEDTSESRAAVAAARDLGEAEARRAIASDPNAADGYASLAILRWSRGETVEADNLLAKATALNPLGEHLDGYALRLGAAGHVKEAAQLMEKVHAVEPFAPQVLRTTVYDFWVDGRNDEAITLAKTMRPADRAPALAIIYASLGQYGAAADALSELVNNGNTAAAQTAQLLRVVPLKRPSTEKISRLPREFEYVFLFTGNPERALAYYERDADVGFFGGYELSLVWHASYAPVRKTDKFKALMKKAGLVEYWKAKGWPDLCHPTTGDDFECS